MASGGRVGERRSGLRGRKLKMTKVGARDRKLMRKGECAQQEVTGIEGCPFKPQAIGDCRQKKRALFSEVCRKRGLPESAGFLKAPCLTEKQSR